MTTVERLNEGEEVYRIDHNGWMFEAALEEGSWVFWDEYHYRRDDFQEYTGDILNEEELDDFFNNQRRV